MIELLTDWLLPYQLDWLLQDVPNEISRKSRRTGMTLVHALKMTLRCADGVDQTVVSMREDSSKLVLKDVVWWLEWLHDHKLTDLSEWDIQATKISHAGGKTITALPAVPRLLRGRKGDVLIDEAAQVIGLPAMLDAARPLQMWGGRLALISSVPRVPNDFTMVCHDPAWAVTELTLHEAVRQGLYKKICVATGRTEPTEQDEADWVDSLITDAGPSADSEYLCKESDGGSTWVSDRSKLNGVPIIRIDDDGQTTNLNLSQAHSIGVDVAGSGAITSICVAGSEGILALIECTGLRQPEIVTLVLSLLNDQTLKIAVDTNGIGAGLYDALYDRVAHGVLVAEPNTSKWFRSVCLTYLNAVYAGEFTGSTDPTWLQDHNGAIVSKGQVLLTRTGNRHCDTVPAAALAYNHKPINTSDNIWLA